MISERIIVFEPNMNSFPHSEVNSGLLCVLELIYNSEKLVFIADKKHYCAIEEVRKIKNWRYIPSKVYSYEPKFFLINDFFLIIKIIILFISSKKTDTLYLLGIMPLSHIFISFINSLFNKKCIIVLHGQMEAYLDDNRLGKSKYYYRLSKFVFKKNDGINYLFFGESIKKNLLFLFDLRKKLLVIDQPYLYQKIEGKKNILKKTIYTLGFLGRFDHSKNTDEFFHFVDSLTQEILEKKIIIKIIGKVNCKFPKKYLNLVTFHEKSLSKEEFDLEVSNLDFVISFTDKNYYKATPSGVFFDCIKWEIPILSLNNDFIEYYFYKYTKLGEIFENTLQMTHFVKNNLFDFNFRYDVYLNYIQNIRVLKKDLTIERIKDNLYRQL